MNRLVVNELEYKDLYWWNSPFCIGHYLHDDYSKLGIDYVKNLLLQVL